MCCYGCRSPISEIETKSPMYIRGVSCLNCYNDKNEKQKNRYLVRQNQIDIAESKQKNHSFKKSI